jgi:hypothetical protein
MMQLSTENVQALIPHERCDTHSITSSLGHMEHESSTHHGQTELLAGPKTILQPVGNPATPVVTLHKIPYDVLVQILRTLSELSERPYLRKKVDEQHFRWHLPHPLGSISLVNRKTRDVCLPTIYEKITVRGDPSHVVRRLGELEELPECKQHYIK